MPFRVGFGYDVHKLAPGYGLILGTVHIPHSKGIIAHSDGDVVIHAICDALLGAASLRDIGYHFPDSDEKFKGINSAVLLQKVHMLITEKGYSIGNIDCTIAIQNPRISPFIVQMRAGISSLLLIDPDQVSIKATTTEQLGFEGREEGVSVYTVVLIEKS
jgi:2-C-methyl-D-erythritol 2,4-cyclodiphosphate synthase